MAQQLPLQFEFRANQTFADFYSGSNQEIIDHLQHCVTGSGEAFIFVWGMPGQGKSHLLQACCHHAQKQELRSFYFDLASPSLPDPSLLSGLDECEVVCLDNIELISGNAAWELAFFNFFNQHRDQGHKLIVSASCSPGSLAIQLPDLKTRLNWGLALKLKMLSDDDRIAALIFKADQLGFEIAPQTGRFLLSHYHRNPQSLWTLLEKLNLASLAAKRKLTVPFLKTILEQDTHDA
ncbi:MAG: DnaA regulatory inactivator Hda [Methylococcaceae bacterium]|nr:DnaA regulatory inactivator Hda [Methylococcaceae bacterium]